MQSLHRVTLGGMHFWGKLDFNMNFPITSISQKIPSQDFVMKFTSGADLSMRYYPWQLLDGKLRPLIGLSANTMQLSLGNETLGSRTEGFITASILSGLSYSFNGWRVNAEWMFLPQNSRDFYINRQVKNKFQLPNSYFSFGLVRHFDFSLAEENLNVSGKTSAIKEKVLKDKSLNSFSIGFAPNGSYSFKSPSFSNDLQSLSKHKGSFNLEYSIGYLMDESKTHFAITYRNYSSHASSYGLNHVMRREALSLEGFKFLTNYHGFVPFVGLSMSGERWATGLFEDNEQQGATVRTNLISPGIIFGWDIQISPIDIWVLRTNLRYYPYQEINDFGGKTSRVDQFEFNFIQLVLYPNRWWNVRNAKKQLYNY